MKFVGFGAPSHIVAAVSSDAVNLILWSLASVGATLAISTGFIFRSMRDAIARRSTWLGKLFSCPMCLGAWVGAALRLAGVGEPFSRCVPLDAVCAGFAASGLCWTLHVVLVRLGSRDL